MLGCGPRVRSTHRTVGGWRMKDKDEARPSQDGPPFGPKIRLRPYGWEPAFVGLQAMPGLNPHEVSVSRNDFGI